MLPVVERFQIYLLSKLSAHNLVAEALARRSLSEEDMREIAAEVSSAFGLEQVGHAADAYEQLAGPAALQQTLAATEASEPFAGSVRHCYALPLWPSVFFAVNHHPAGWAWGQKFCQRAPVFPDVELSSWIQRVHPWAFADDVLVRAAARIEVLEEWSTDQSLQLTFHPRTGQPLSFRAHFDLGLLQSWTPEPADRASIAGG